MTIDLNACQCGICGRIFKTFSAFDRHMPEHRDHWSKKNPETRAEYLAAKKAAGPKISAGKKGKPRRVHVNAQTVRPGTHVRSDEERAKISSTLSAWWVGDNKQTEAQLAHTREVQRLAVESRRGLTPAPKSPEGLEKCRQAALEQWKDPEHREKMERVNREVQRRRREAAQKKVCSVEDCPTRKLPQGKRRKLRRGWCNAHYLNWYRYGHPLATADTPLIEVTIDPEWLLG